MIKILPSNAKVDVRQAFNFCEDKWGSKGLMALVVYGSATKELSRKIWYEDRKFLWFKWKDCFSEIIYPNDIDVAAIYDEIKFDELLKKSCCRFRGLFFKPYSAHWEDIDKYADMHLMCVSYETLINNKNIDTNMASVLNGILIWGRLPRPIKSI